MPLSKFSNRPANAVAGERDDLLAHLHDGVSLGPHSLGPPHWFAPLLKQWSEFCAELLGQKTEVSDNLGQKSISRREANFCLGQKIADEFCPPDRNDDREFF
jgi:hypothetical protein